MALVLTDRDIKLLKELAEKRVLSKEYVKDNIYEVGNYYNKRLWSLNKEKYIIRDTNIVYLGAKGEDYLNNIGIVIKKAPTTKSLKLRNAWIMDTAYKLEPEWKLIPSWEMKKNENEEFNRGALFSGYIENQVEGRKGEKMFIYHIGGKALSKVKAEISALKEKYHNLKVMVLVKSEKVILEYGIDTMNLREYIALLENDDEYKLMKLKARERIEDKAVKMFYKEYGPARLVQGGYGDFHAEGKDVVVLLIHDIEKIFAVKTYLDIQVQNPNDIRVTIICLDSQKKLYEKVFSENMGFEIKTVSIEKLLFKISEEEMETARYYFNIAGAMGVEIQKIIPKEKMIIGRFPNSHETLSEIEYTHIDLILSWINHNMIVLKDDEKQAAIEQIRATSTKTEKSNRG